MGSLTECAEHVRRLLGERYRNRASGRLYLVVGEAAGICTLEGIDRVSRQVARAILDNPNSAWERQL